VSVSCSLPLNKANQGRLFDIYILDIFISSSMVKPALNQSARKGKNIYSDCFARTSAAKVYDLYGASVSNKGKIYPKVACLLLQKGENPLIPTPTPLVAGLGLFIASQFGLDKSSTLSLCLLSVSIYPTM
jgi:hypothetical protein